MVPFNYTHAQFGPHIVLVHNLDLKLSMVYDVS